MALSDDDPHRAPSWLPALIRAPAGGVVTDADQPQPVPSVAAMQDAAAAEPAGGEERLEMLPLDAIRPNPGQPRRSIDEGELHALAASIAEQGVIQPIVVRPVPGEAGRYEIVAGERRWRAARLAGRAAIPALVRPLNDVTLAEIALVENIQRAELAPLDEALAYQQLIEVHGRTQDEVARRLGRNRTHVAHMLRLLRLPAEVQEMIRSGAISVGHARVLVNVDDPVALARRVVAEGLTVRQTEEAAKAARPAPAPRGAEAPPAQTDTAAWADRFRAALARPVAIRPGRQGGSLVIPYDSEDDLASILARISR
jgi:ParB family chromosome partitioning protein